MKLLENGGEGPLCLHDGIYISLPPCEINILLNAEKILDNGGEHCDLFLMIEHEVNAFEYVLIEAKNFNSENSIRKHILGEGGQEVSNKCIFTKSLIDKDFKKFMTALHTNRRVKINSVFLLYGSDFVYDFFKNNSSHRIQLKRKLMPISSHNISQARLHRTKSS